MATDPKDLMQRNILGQGAHYGQFAADVTNLTNLAFVILPDFDETLSWGPCRWQSRDAVTLPRKGDPCLLVFDNQNKPWVVAWWPF